MARGNIYIVRIFVLLYDFINDITINPILFSFYYSSILLCFTVFSRILMNYDYMKSPATFGALSTVFCAHCCVSVMRVKSFLTSSIFGFPFPVSTFSVFLFT